MIAVSLNNQGPHHVAVMPEEAAAGIVAKAEAKRVEADAAHAEYDPPAGAP